MRRFILRLCIALLTFSLGCGVFFVQKQIKGTPYSDQLSLRFIPEKTVVKIDEYPVVKLYITNNGNETVTLVRPGDGSESAWRTPIVQWSILDAGDATSHPAAPDLTPKFRGCGNINALKWNEVFTVAPGETIEIERGLPTFRKAGNYRVTMFYTNRPSMQWLGVELGTHHPIAMWRVRNSTECSLTSNEVLFTVTE